MSRPKSRRVGAGTLIRYRDGVCTFTCHHAGCRAYSEPRGWRGGLRQAREHAADHYATEARYALTAKGIPAMEMPAARRRRRLHLGRLAVVALVLAVLAFTVTAVTHATPAPPAPSYDYIPTPAGPPASSPTGGDR